MKNRTITLLFVVLVLTACASTVPLASPSEDAAAKSLQPQSGKSLLYIFRQAGYFGKAILFRWHSTAIYLVVSPPVPTTLCRWSLESMRSQS